jgi:hypothetical protein
MTIRMNNPAIAGTKYMSAGDVGVVVGAAVGAGTGLLLVQISLIWQ